MVYIAWQQMSINAQKLRFDKYERRLKVYDEVRLFLNTIQRDRRVEDIYLIEFKRAMSAADFLFKPDITDYLKQIHIHAELFLEWSDKKRDFDESGEPNSKRNKIGEGLKAERKWLTHQQEAAKKLFKKYLSVG